MASSLPSMISFQTSVSRPNIVGTGQIIPCQVLRKSIGLPIGQLNRCLYRHLIIKENQKRKKVQTRHRLVGLPKNRQIRGSEEVGPVMNSSDLVMKYQKRHPPIRSGIFHPDISILRVQKKKKGPSADFCLLTKKCAPKSVVTLVFQKILPKKCGALFYAWKYSFQVFLLSNTQK